MLQTPGSVMLSCNSPLITVGRHAYFLFALRRDPRQIRGWTAAVDIGAVPEPAVREPCTPFTLIHWNWELSRNPFAWSIEKPESELKDDAT